MNSATHLHRQIHPSWIEENEISSQAFEATITSQAFTPTIKDEKKLSVANGEKLSARQSYDLHTNRGLKSGGVMSVTGEECESVSLAYTEDNDPFDGHSIIDYSSCQKSEIKTKAKKLKAFASERGWSYRPENIQHDNANTTQP